MRWTLTLSASLVAAGMLLASGCLLPAQKPWDTLDDDSADAGITLADDDDAADELMEDEEYEEEIEAEETDGLLE